MLSAFSCRNQDEELQKAQTPIWREINLERLEGPTVTYEETVNIQPTFYKGSMPLSFRATKKLFDRVWKISLYQEFEEFRNTFIYPDRKIAFSGIASGARTTDASGRLLAEARLLRLISEETEQLQGIEIEEFHYDTNGRFKFKCKSKIDFRMGFKSAETERIGKKTRDYYFIWPVESSSMIPPPIPSESQPGFGAWGAGLGH